MCPSPLWRLKGDRYLDTVPRLNDWNGNEGAPSQPRSLPFPRRPDLRMAIKGYLLQDYMAVTLEVLNLVLYLATLGYIGNSVK